MAKFFIQTMGCQMNKNDSERIAGLLSSRGLEQTDRPNSADVLIINSCGVRQTAEDRVLGFVKNWQELKNKKPEIIICVTGCMPGRDKDGKLRKKIPGADLFFAIDELPRLPIWLAELNPEIQIANGETGSEYLDIAPKRDKQVQGFISIQTGCNNFCTYCVVPFARGRERNRPVKKILSEINDFIANGGRQITLLGQVVNHYIAPDPENFSPMNPFIRVIPAPMLRSGLTAAGIQSRQDCHVGLRPPRNDIDHFAALLWEINQIEKLNRAHFTAPDAQYFSDYQIQALSLPKQMNYLHLPAQSGSNEILKKMNRKYTREEYLTLIKKIRAACPEIAIGTDLIVGFCGETKEQFEETLSLYHECDFDISYHAMYSERSGTPAAKAFRDDVPREEKKRRWDELQSLMEKIVYKKNQKYVGRIVEVLVEDCREGICSGNSREMKLTQFIGADDLVDTIVSVKIFEAKEWVLKGELIK